MTTQHSSSSTVADELAARAVAYFGEGGFYCAESVLMVLAERQGIDNELIPSIATGMCSGMARTSGLCGALTGAILGLGLAVGRSEAFGDVDTIYAKTGRVVRGFEEAFGSRNCGELLGVDLSTPEGQAGFREQGLKEARCLKFTDMAVRLALKEL